MNKLDTILLVVAVACISIIVLITCGHPEKYDHAPVEQLQKQEEQLKVQKKQLDSIANYQAALVEQNRKKDSVLVAHFQSDEQHNKEVINQLIQIKNEKIKRIGNYNSDSLRRAFSE